MIDVGKIYCGGMCGALLSWNGGGANSTGVGIGNIDFLGYVHPDQFWKDYTLGPGSAMVSQRRGNRA